MLLNLHCNPNSSDNGCRGLFWALDSGRFLQDQLRLLSLVLAPRLSRDSEDDAGERACACIALFSLQGSQSRH